MTHIQSKTYRPRDMRSKFLGARAAAQYRGDAMAAAVAQIGAEFGEAAAINSFKMRVERVILFGASHPAIQARYRTRAAMLLGLSLWTATHLIEHRYRDERTVFQIASALGFGNRLSLDVLGELRLILRWARRHSYGAQFQSFLYEVLE